MTSNNTTTFHRLSNTILVDGVLKKAVSQETLPVINPATCEDIGSIASCGEVDLNSAVLAAQDAFKTWRKYKNQERGARVAACGQILKENAKELAILMSLETGKAIRTESRVELDVVADTFAFYAGLALELKGDTIPFDPGMLTYTVRQPHGVVGAIVPWNVPLLLMAMKVAPALVAGNTVVLKASPEASICLLRAAELMNTILPPGVFNVITGGAETGKLLVAHKDIQKVTFTGSVEAGRHVYQAAAEKIIPVTLELGGKSPLIICADADLDKVAQCVYEGMRFTRQGQSCSAASRILIHESIQDAFVQKLLAILDQKIIGDPMDEKTDIGTIISQAQFDRVQGFVSLAEKDPRLQIHYGSKLPSDLSLKKGLFMRPMLVTGLQNNHPICRQEIFGPLAAIIAWSDFDDALAMANDTDFGLAAGIWTRDIAHALNAAHALEAGFVQVNQYTVYRPSLQFGGFKNSGIGNEASLNAMLEGYTKEKTVIINLT